MQEQVMTTPNNLNCRLSRKSGVEVLIRVEVFYWGSRSEMLAIDHFVCQNVTKIIFLASISSIDYTSAPNDFR